MSDKLMLVKNDHVNTDFTCALCGAKAKADSHFVVTTKDGADVCDDCVESIEPAFNLMIDLFHELCNTACNDCYVQDGKEPYYVIDHDLPLDLAYAALETAYPLAPDASTVQ